MAAERPFHLLHTADQWQRCAHQATALTEGVVELARVAEADDLDAYPNGPPAAGLCFDPWCRLLRSEPETGQVLRQRWTPETRRQPDAATPLFQQSTVSSLGDFSIRTVPPPLYKPRGLSVDDQGYLTIVQADGKDTLVVNLIEHRVVRRLHWNAEAPNRVPADCASAGDNTILLLSEAPFLLQMQGLRGPWNLDIRDNKQRQLNLADLGKPSRVTMNAQGHVAVLFDRGDPRAAVLPLWLDAARRLVADTDELFVVPFASDLVLADTIDGRQELVVSRRPGEDLLRYSVASARREALPKLKGRRFDGRAIARAPDGRIAFWTSNGPRLAVPARPKYARQGRVTSFQLDSKRFQNKWGRLFLDACLPANTGVQVACWTADELPEGDKLPWTPPKQSELLTIHRPDLTPPLPLADSVPMVDDAGWQKVHRRENGRELAWLPSAVPGGFETYECPTRCAPGRYLWIAILLTGNGLQTPRVGSLRVERQAHELLERLPGFFAANADTENFLGNYLAPLAGLLGELEAQAFHRRALLDPTSTPAEALDWLAGFVGLALDSRWPVAKRRRLIQHAAELFRWRGTQRGLRQWIQLYLDREPVLLEHFRLRSHFTALTGAPQVAGMDTNRPRVTPPILGAGFQIGGSLGRRHALDQPVTESKLAADEPPSAGEVLMEARDDGHNQHAHRFSVVVPASLDGEQRSVVEHILEQHRPAHTIYELCTIDSGLRIGVGLHLGLNSLVGRSSGFEQLQVSASSLGTNAILGRAPSSMTTGAARLGVDSRVN